MEKINWNKQRNDFANNMIFPIIWDDGSDLQQELADKVMDSFCKRFAKYLCWGIRDNILELNDATNITDIISEEIQNIDSAKWWCSKKNTSDFTIALKLLQDYEEETTIVKKIKKEYE